MRWFLGKLPACAQPGKHGESTRAPLRRDALFSLIMATTISHNGGCAQKQWLFLKLFFRCYQFMKLNSDEFSPTTCQFLVFQYRRQDLSGHFAGPEPVITLPVGTVLCQSPPPPGSPTSCLYSLLVY